MALPMAGGLLRAYNRGRRIHQLAIRLIDSLYTGLWLGLLDRAALHYIDEQYYSDQSCYYDHDYNQGGLFGWEETVVKDYFGNCRRILVIGAGGGREVLALVRMGYQVDGVECHRGLVDCGNKLLASAGVSSRIQWAPRDQLPLAAGSYDGIIIGWGMYMLIQGRRHRVSFLRDLHERVQKGGPLLLSFFTRFGSEYRYKFIAALGSVLRRLRCRELVEPGDMLSPNYVHLFDEPEIAAELAAGGFKLIVYSTKDYGHAVATAL